MSAVLTTAATAGAVSGDNPSLIILMLVPLAASLGIFLMPERATRQAKVLALVASLAVAIFTLVIGLRFDTAKVSHTTQFAKQFQFVGSWNWIRDFGVHLAFGVDGIALVLIGMAVVLVPVVIIASWNSFDSRAGSEEAISVGEHAESVAAEAGGSGGARSGGGGTATAAPPRTVPGTRRRSAKTYFGLVLLLEFFMIGVFASMDVFVFYVFFEAMLVPMYFIIGSFGGPRRQYAAMKFFLYSLVGGLIMLASVIGLYVESGTGTFSITELVAHPLPDNAVQKWLFLGFFIAFAIKAPLVPVHTWLPDAGAEAPFGGAALLVGVLDKVGTFGFLRYCLPLFPDASKWFAPTVLILGVVGILYAAFLAIGQRDLKRLISYTSIAHFGFIALGIFVFTTQGGSGAVLYMVNHGFSTGALFLVAGYLIVRGKSRNIDDYGGVAKATPILAGMFLLAGLSALALPGMSTFVSEFLVLVGTFTRHKGLAILATTGIILAAIYVLHTYRRIFQGPERPGGKINVSKFRDLNAREIIAVAPLILLILLLGVYPKPVLDVINPAVKATQAVVHKTDPTPKLGTVEGAK